MTNKEQLTSQEEAKRSLSEDVENVNEQQDVAPMVNDSEHVLRARKYIAQVAHDLCLQERIKTLKRFCLLRGSKYSEDELLAEALICRDKSEEQLVADVMSGKFDYMIK